MFGLRTPELLIILAIVILVFGANKIPQLGKALGETIRGFKKAVDENEPEASKQAPPAQLSSRPASAAKAVEPEVSPAEKKV